MLGLRRKHMIWDDSQWMSFGVTQIINVIHCVTTPHFDRKLYGDFVQKSPKIVETS